jgi:hypothetical protein
MAANRSIEEIARMTDNYLPEATPPQRGYEPFLPASAEEQGTADVVKDQATDLTHSGIQTGKHVAEVAREQASGVAAEAGRQGRGLLHEAQGQLEEQAGQGQQMLAKQLLSLSDELRSMAASGQGGMAAGLASQAASRAGNAGRWLDDRKPGQVVAEVQSFARRKPAVFLALAVGAGLVAGRLTRGLKDANSDDSTAAVTPVGFNDQTLGVSVPASELPAAGDDPAWAVAPAYFERSPLVTDDQAGPQGTL